MIKEKANYITVKDLAELVDVGTETIRREIADSALPAKKIRNVYRIRKDDAKKWLERKDYIQEDEDA